MAVMSNTRTPLTRPEPTRSAIARRAFPRARAVVGNGSSTTSDVIAASRTNNVQVLHEPCPYATAVDTCAVPKSGNTLPKIWADDGRKQAAARQPRGTTESQSVRGLSVLAVSKRDAHRSRLTGLAQDQAGVAGLDRERGDVFLVEDRKSVV